LIVVHVALQQKATEDSAGRFAPAAAATPGLRATYPSPTWRHADSAVLHAQSDELRLDELRLDELRLDELRLDELRLDELRLDELRLSPFYYER